MPPTPVMAPPTSIISSSLVPLITSIAPAAPRASAKPRPRPRLAPVTTMRFPSSGPISDVHLIAQLPLEYLAGGIAGQFLHEHDVLGLLVRRHLRTAQLDDLVGVHRHAGARLDDSHDL